MDDDFDLRDFSNVCRLFPLPQVVLFPHAVLPLHIFEPRYRRMTEDALADDQLVTIVQSRPTRGVRTLGLPPIAEIACLGRILQHERLPDGRFNFLLLGRKRVRLLREIPADTPYRQAEVEILEDEEADEPEESRRAALVARFRAVFQQHRELDPDMAALLETAVPIAVLTDLITHALGLPAEIKQAFLGETRVGRRFDRLMTILDQIARHGHVRDEGARDFPPPFSPN